MDIHHNDQDPLCSLGELPEEGLEGWGGGTTALKDSTDSKKLTACQYLRDLCFQKPLQHSCSMGNVFGNTLKRGRQLRPIRRTDSSSQTASQDSPKNMPGRLKKRWHFYVFIYFNIYIYRHISIYIYSDLHPPILRVCVEVLLGGFSSCNSFHR